MSSDIHAAKNYAENEFVVDIDIVYLCNNDLLSKDWLHINDIEAHNNISSDDEKRILDLHAKHAVARLKAINMSEKRLAHSVSTANYAKYIMSLHSNNELLIQKAFVAGLYHDFAKQIPIELQKLVADAIGLKDYRHHNLLHAYVGSSLIRSVYLFSDKSILQAINRHTQPYEYYQFPPDMLAKVLYIADKLEPMRTSETMCNMPIDLYRKLAEENIDECFNIVHQFLSSKIKD